MSHISERTVPCRECQKPIRFITTPQGKRMPVDAEAVDTRDRQPGEKVVTEKGEIRTVSKGMTLKAFLPHWATCAAPNRFRKRGRKDAAPRAGFVEMADPDDAFFQNDDSIVAGEE